MQVLEDADPNKENAIYLEARQIKMGNLFAPRH